VGELETLRTQAIANLKQIGGKQVSGNTAGTNKLVDDAETYLKTTEAERARRSQIPFGPPQFHTGGVVTPELAFLSPGIPGARAYHTGGEVNANLLVGEGVLSRRGMSAVGGEAGLNNLNAGGGAVEVHMHFPSVYDANGFEQTLMKNTNAIKKVLFKMGTTGQL
jgi:hypothetical protein